MEGTVQDDSGAVLPGVTVTVRNSDTGLERVIVTEQDGHFVVPGLPPGNYQVKAELQGFQPAEQSGLALHVGQTTSVSLVLRVGNLSENITVLAAAPLVEVSKTDFSSVVNSNQIDNLPINGRNFLDFATLTPGVVLNQSTAINGIGANVAGARSRNGSVLVDGFNNLDDGFTSPRLIYSQEAIQEFQVLTLGFSAEFGRATGGIVNAVTKSGTNRLEGRLFNFFRDKSLNARNAFEQGGKAGFRRWQWGGTIGGPIKKDKLFFFGSFERQDFTAPTVVTISQPTASILGLAATELGAQQKRDDYSTFLGKISQNRSNSNMMEYTVAHSRFVRANLTGVGGLATPSSGTGTRAKDWLLAGKWTHVFGNGRMVNELRGSYNPRAFFVDPQGEGPRVSVSGVATWGRATNSPNEQHTQQGQFIDHLSYTVGKHDMKVGVDFYPVSYKIFFPGGVYGSYAFSSLANFQTGNYTSYSQTFGEDTFLLPHAFYAGFAQDSFRVLDHLTLNLGLRYEYEAQPKWNGIQYPSDKNNFGPRAGFAWDISGNSRAVFRAETGLFYDKNFGNIPLNTFRGLDGVTRAYTFLGRTAAGAPQYPAVLTTEPDAAALGSSNVRVMIEDPSIPQAWQTNLALDFAVSGNTAATVSYLRNDQTRQYVNITRNRLQNINGVRQRPDPTHGTISVYEPSGVSLYNGVSVELRRRLTNGLAMNGSYTYGNAKADSNDFGSGYVDENHREWEYGPTPDDVRHNIVLNGTYAVPHTNLNVGGIYRFNTGRPYSASAGADINGDGVNNDRALGFEDKPNSFRMGSMHRTDLRLAYRLKASTRTVELIGEVFNIFNQTFFTSVNTTWGSTTTAQATFGRPLTAADPRVVQLGVRYLF
jgi:outer membrane receptor for ferrienterochelin and colicin